MAARLAHLARNLRPRGITPDAVRRSIACSLPFKATGTGGGQRGYLASTGAGHTYSPPVRCPPRGVYPHEQISFRLVNPVPVQYLRRSPCVPRHACQENTGGTSRPRSGWGECLGPRQPDLSPLPGCELPGPLENRWPRHAPIIQSAGIPATGADYRHLAQKHSLSPTRPVRGIPAGTGAAVSGTPGETLQSWRTTVVITLAARSISTVSGTTANYRIVQVERLTTLSRVS